MGNYDYLDEFTLASHGDHREQEWASVIAEHFPAYEVFWRRYIVSLTNRVDAGISFSRDRDVWIRLRDDVRPECEQMAMLHYSVFYYLARAILKIRIAEGGFPEDVFALLDACGDNVLAFFASMQRILTDFDVRADFLPIQKNELWTKGQRSKPNISRGAFVEVQAYRDTILHNPVLGRGMQVSREFLPKPEFLPKVKLSWREAARLKPDQLIALDELDANLLADCGGFLQGTWEPLIAKLDAVRETDKFRKQWALDGRFPLTVPPQIIASTSQPLSASGGHAIPNSPTAVMLAASVPREPKPQSED
jgi:hypothetical protein